MNSMSFSTGGSVRLLAQTRGEFAEWRESLKRDLAALAAAGGGSDVNVT